MIRYFPDLVQGSDEWMEARCGLLTASEMKRIVTPTLKPARNDTSRAHAFEIAAQRITRHVEPTFIGDNMLRGMEDETYARDAYRKAFADTDEAGFITNDRFGFTLGYSPDGVVGDDGLIECKSRRQKFQIQTIVTREVPPEHTVQVQAALLVTERAWCDFISYSGGLPMVTIRVYPDAYAHAAIIEAAEAFEGYVAEIIEKYGHALAEPGARLVPTERVERTEMFV